MNVRFGSETVALNAANSSFSRRFPRLAPNLVPLVVRISINQCSLKTIDRRLQVVEHFVFEGYVEIQILFSGITGSYGEHRLE